VTGAPFFVPGTPCWVDASTTDPAGSRDFYAGLFGWSYHVDSDPESGYYTHALLDGRPVAGLAGIPSEHGRPTWTTYLATTNIAYTAAVVELHGGRVLYGPADSPREGSMLLCGDPTGAVIGFWQSSAPWVFHNHGPGAFCWAELNTWDGTSADQFFARIFGYRQHQIGDLATTGYTIWTLGDQTRLGRLRMGPGFPPDTAPHWLPHFAVDPDIGIDAAAFRAVQLGGRLRVDPFDSWLGRSSVVDDPFGATFGLLDATRRVEPEGGPAAVDDPFDD
jgi:predicted enzyme related to lactoylglutathione lyase